MPVEDFQALRTISGFPFNVNGEIIRWAHSALGAVVGLNSTALCVSTLLCLLQRGGAARVTPPGQGVHQWVGGP